MATNNRTRSSRSWLRLTALLLFVAPLSTGLQSALARQDAQAQPAQPPPLYDESADAAKDIKHALATAQRENRRVLIQWGANWCGWCRILNEKFTTDPDLRKKLQYEYDVVHVDIGHGEKNLDLADKYGADFKTNGVPYLTILNADGEVLVNQETEFFEKDDKERPRHDAARLLTFLTKHQAPYLPAESILSDALVQAKKTDRNLFVHFGAPWCGWCHRLEDWMHTEVVAKTLAVDFVNVKIDIDRTIGGKEMLEEYRKGKGSGIPWFVFLDPQGKVIVNSNGPDGKNIGCPWTEDEIAAFRAIIAKATRKLTDGQLDKLVKTMGPKPAN